MLPAADGSRYGFRGWVTLRPRPDAWRELHDASGGDGLEGALVDAVRAAAAGLGPGAERSGDGPGLARRLERGLTAALAERGIDLRRLELDAVDFLAAGPGAAVTDTRLLVIGLDGLDWEILDPLLEAGRLPNLARLIENGVRAKLLTISPMLSPVIWTTVATGVEPSRHGVLDFLVDDVDGGSRQPVTSVQRRAPTVWEILSKTGVEVGVCGWWASWPADAVRGYVVSDRIAYQLFEYRADPEDAQGKTWPPALYDEVVRPRIRLPEQVSWDEVAAYLGGGPGSPDAFDAEDRERVEGLRTLLASGETYLDVADLLRRRFEPRLEIAYFEGTDTVGHLFMPFRPPPLAGVDPRRIAAFGEVVDRYYETADRYLGRLLADRGGDWTVMVLSDHGFASDATRPRTTDSRIGHGAAADWHRRFGVLILSGARVRAGARLEEASVYDVAPTILALFGEPVPRSWPGRVLADAIDPEFLDAHPVRFRADDPVREELQAANLDDPAAADLLEKLRSLGYVSAEAGAGQDDITARNNAGVALLAEGRFAEAEAEFRRGLEVAPDAPMLVFNLAMALELQGRTAEAEPELRRVLDTPMTRRMAGNLLAGILLERGELDEAERLLRDVLAVEPGAADVRTTLGQVLDRAGRTEEARTELRRAAELDPDAAMPRNHLGSIARRSGDLDAAERWYESAIEADPYFMGAYNNLALVYQDRGQLDRAADLYARALAKAPENADVLNNLGSLHYARGEMEDARRYWLRSAAADADEPSPLNNLAGIEITEGRLDEAERLLQRALVLDPGYGDARINLALVRAARGDLDGARAELRRATTDPRTGFQSWAKLGTLELEAGRLDDAVAALEQAAERAPANVEVLNVLGEAYRVQGRADRAARAWERSLELNPAQPRLRAAWEQLRQAE